MAKEKPNVLFIISDQHRYDHMGCAGNSIVKTPNLDLLSREGVHFNNAFCSNPMCMPNRATLLTGLYPNVHEVRSNGMILSNEFPTITDILAKRGWHTAAFGKLHHQFNVAPFRSKHISAESFHDWVFPKRKNQMVGDNFPKPYYGYQEVETVLGHGAYLCGHYLDWLEKSSPQLAENMRNRVKNIDNFFSVFTEHEIPVELYSSAYVADRTIAFFERVVAGDYANKPFYCHCSFPDPHQPVYPPGEYRNMYDPMNMPLPPNYTNLVNLRSHPYLAPYINVMPGAMLRETNEEELKKFIAYTYGTVSLVDHYIGEILAALERLGLAENTIVVYTSDHGDLMGEHGMLFKGPTFGNGVLQVPMIWKVPGITSPGRTEALMSSIDYPKTLMHLLGLGNQKDVRRMQGYDLTPVLENPANGEVYPRSGCFIEHDEEVGPLYERLRHLITPEYKLTVYEGHQNYGDLFDRKNDPHELNNLWFDEHYRDIRFDMLKQLLHENLTAQSRYHERLAGT
ncbi:MAG: sulfatase family protein [Promethearchaeota archaeon]